MNSFNVHLVERDVASLRPYDRNARTHSRKQIKQIAASIERFGFTNPVLVTDDGQIIAGHGRVEAAKLLGLRAVPTIALSHLSETERRAYVLADNKLALNAGWDREILAIELQGLIDLEFDVELTGFSLAEVDFVLDEAGEADPGGEDAAEDHVPALAGPAVSRIGDAWELGRHRLVCGDARSLEHMVLLMGDDRADMVFTDPPYNVKIDGHVCGLGSVKHREFAMATGEMSEAQFVKFLEDSLGNMAGVMRDGAIAFVCMDWRHMGELLVAGRSVFTELKNLVVWNKTNGGMGAFYRSKHELIFVFKQGTAEHTNSFGLGEPTPLPHPDDVVVDLRMATVHFNGPVTPEDKFHWDARLQRRDEAQAEVTYYADLHHAEDNPERKERLLEDWHFEQRMFDLINDNLPRRYRKTLENRSWAAGASRPGSLKRREWPGE